ncbi:TPA: hypothetical protein VAM21_003625 [Acinetobacter baumannii]|nr:hypothetical protein [Acinetobacter baumannii]
MNNEKTFMGKNKFFYLNIVFTLVFTIFSYFLNKFIASTNYVPLGIAIFTIITVFLSKMKEYIDENDSTSFTGKIKKQLIEKEKEVKNLRELIQEKQAKINSLVLKIQESQSLEKLKETLVIWYINTDKECYYGEKAENKLNEANQKAIDEMNKYMSENADI